MKITISLFVSALAQYDYNGNTDLDQDNGARGSSIARGVRYKQPISPNEDELDQFSITKLASQLSSNSGEIDFNALAQMLFERQNGQRESTTTPKTIRIPKPTKSAKGDERVKTVNVVKQTGKSNRKTSFTNKTKKTKKTTARPRTPYQGPMKAGFRGGDQSKDPSDTRGHNFNSKISDYKRRQAAHKFAAILMERRAEQARRESEVFDETGSGSESTSLGRSTDLVRAAVNDQDWGAFYDYYEGDFNEFYDYAEELIETNQVQKNVDWSTELGKLNEVLGENRSPISCWTCKRTYWDNNSSGDLWDDCRTYGQLVTCPNQHLEDPGAPSYSSPVSCQITEHRFFGVTSELEVGCKQTRACQNNFLQNRMTGSVYGRTCRVESTFGTSKCRQCCATDSCFDGTTNTLARSFFDEDSEWFDTAAHATYSG